MSHVTFPDSFCLLPRQFVSMRRALQCCFTVGMNSLAIVHALVVAVVRHVLVCKQEL